MSVSSSVGSSSSSSVRDSGSSRDSSSAKPATASATADSSNGPATVSGSKGGGGVNATAVADSAGETTAVRATNDSVDVSSTTQPEKPNPYGDFAPYSEAVTAEKWTKDRTPGEGQVTRDDHVAGMLQNRGFSNAEIYAKDADGKTLADRVAAANNLENPNLIREGQSYVLPSRNPPESVEASADAQAKAFENAFASATADQDVGTVNNREVEARATASAEAERGAAEANAAVDQKVEAAINSEVGARADAKAKSEQGPATAIARVDQSVTRATGSEVKAKAEAAASSNEGPAKAKAVSAQDVGQVKDSALTNEASAVAAAPDATAEATAETKVAEMTNSSVATEANARTETGKGAPVEARATTEVEAERASGVDIKDSAAVTGLQASVEQATSVENNQAGLSVSMEAKPGGEESRSSQQVDIDGKGSATVKVTSAAVTAEQSVVNHANPENAFGGTHYAPGDHSKATVVSTGASTVDQTIQGFSSVDQQVHGADLAPLGSDAQNARYEATGAGMVNGVHTGVNGKVDISAQASDQVYFRDREHMGPRMNEATGNVLGGTVQAPQIKIDTAQSKDFDGTLKGTDGDDRQEVLLPSVPGETRQSNTLISELGKGNDFLIASDGNPNVLASKESGTMNLNLTGAQGDNASMAFDANAAELRGRVDLSGVANAKVDISTLGANHDVTFQGGDGTNDTVTIHLTGDAAAPRVVTQEGSSGILGLFSSPDQGYLPEGAEGVIKAPGFERVVVVRDGKVETTYGGEVDQAPSFEHAAEEIRNGVVPG